MRPFRAARGGGAVARLDRAEADIVALLLDQLEQLMEADADDVGGDPVLARLLPDGHGTASRHSSAGDRRLGSPPRPAQETGHESFW